MDRCIRPFADEKKRLGYRGEGGGGGQGENGGKVDGGEGGC